MKLVCGTKRAAGSGAVPANPLGIGCRFSPPRALSLSALELAILNCYMNGMRQAEVCAELGIGRGTINHRKASIRQRYYSLYGEF